MTHGGRHTKLGHTDLSTKRGQEKAKKEFEEAKRKGTAVREERKKREGKGRREEPVRKEKPTIFLNKPQPTREEAIETITGETRFSDVREFGVTGSEFGQKKREVFAKERPTEKMILDVFSGITLGALGAKVAIPFLASTAVGSATTVGKTAPAVTFGTKEFFKTAGRFSSNIKSVGLTTSFLRKIGGAPALLAVIGSYPFAGFIKEEALQTLSFAVKSARDAGNLEEEQEAIDRIDVMLNPSTWSKILASIPFANVVAKLKDFYEAAAKKNEIDQASLDKRLAISTGEVESDFARERRESDEAARERDVAAQEEDTAFFDEQREIQRQEKLEEQELDSQYFRLIREKKFDEAEELLQSRLNA